jgi:hypothetical protein
MLVSSAWCTRNAVTGVKRCQRLVPRTATVGSKSGPHRTLQLHDRQGPQVAEKLVASIADRDIAVSGVMPPNPQMDLSKAPPGFHKLIAATGLTPQRIWN